MSFLPLSFTYRSYATQYDVLLYTLVSGKLFGSSNTVLKSLYVS